MIGNNLKQDFFKFMNPRNLFFIILLLILIVLFNITKFSTTLTKFFEQPDNKFNFNKFLKKNFFPDSNLKQLIIPNETSMTENEIFMASEKESNLALIYWSNWKKLDKNQNKLNGNFTVCGIKLPSPHLLKFNNIHWQTMFVNNNLTLHLYNAYYDNREEIKKVKVISATNHQKTAEGLNLW
jgi:hypothetical protein